LKALEQVVQGMSQGYDRITKEQLAFAEENELLRNIIAAHGLEPSINGPSESANAVELIVPAPESLYSYTQRSLLKTSFAAKSKLRVCSYVQYRKGRDPSMAKEKQIHQTKEVIQGPKSRTPGSELASFSAESSFINIEQRRCLDSNVRSLFVSVIRSQIS
jgi:hypothetical protein